MQVFKDYNNLPETARRSVLAIGNFDGVHRGHQALIKAAKETAGDKPLAVMTFSPHPRKVFQPDCEPFALTGTHTKMRKLEEHGVDIVFDLPFDEALYSLSGQTFVQQILVDGINTSHVFVGEGFTFGHKRSGTIETLKSGGFDVTAFAPEKNAQDTVFSSTQIRKHLHEGNVAAANEMLGWNWEIENIVIQGDQRGRELGYPTANMELDDYTRPRFGVYAAQVSIENGPWQPGVANIGIRPMFESPTPLAETFIFDFDSDIYGANLRLRPIAHLRDEAKFDTLEALKAQIAKDCLIAQEALKK